MSGTRVEGSDVFSTFVDLRANNNVSKEEMLFLALLVLSSARFQRDPCAATSSQSPRAKGGYESAKREGERRAKEDAIFWLFFVRLLLPRLTLVRPSLSALSLFCSLFDNTNLGGEVLLLDVRGDTGHLAGLVVLFVAAGGRVKRC